MKSTILFLEHWIYRGHGFPTHLGWQSQHLMSQTVVNVHCVCIAKSFKLISNEMNGIISLRGNSVGLRLMGSFSSLAVHRLIWEMSPNLKKVMKLIQYLVKRLEGGTKIRTRSNAFQITSATASFYSRFVKWNPKHVTARNDRFSSVDYFIKATKVFRERFFLFMVTGDCSVRQCVSLFCKCGWNRKNTVIEWDEIIYLIREVWTKHAIWKQRALSDSDRLMKKYLFEWFRRFSTIIYVDLLVIGEPLKVHRPFSSHSILITEWKG